MSFLAFCQYINSVGGFNFFNERLSQNYIVHKLRYDMYMINASQGVVCNPLA